MAVRRHTVVGWTELVSLPDWGVTRLRAKIDTGARSSALHVTDLKPLPGSRVSFVVVLSRKKAHRRVRVEARVCRRARVRSSTGTYTTRYFVRTLLRLGPIEKEIEVSLVDREEMLFRMLLGRTALATHFLVDPGRARVASPRRSTPRKEGS